MSRLPSGRSGWPDWLTARSGCVNSCRKSQPVCAAPSGRDPRTKRSETRKAKRIVAAEFVTATVHRLDVDAFVSVRDQLSIERRSFEHLVDHRSPLVIVDRREIILDGKFSRYASSFIGNSQSPWINRPPSSGFDHGREVSKPLPHVHLPAGSHNSVNTPKELFGWRKAICM